MNGSDDDSDGSDDDDDDDDHNDGSDGDDGDSDGSDDDDGYDDGSDDDDGGGDQFYHTLTCTYIYSYIPTTTNRQKIWRQRFATTKIQALWRRALVRTALYDPYKVGGWMNGSKCGLRVKSCHDTMAVDSLQSCCVSYHTYIHAYIHTLIYPSFYHELDILGEQA